MENLKMAWEFPGGKIELGANSIGKEEQLWFNELPICAYGTIIIRSKNKDLYVELMCSNNKTVEEMKKLAQNPS